MISGSCQQAALLSAPQLWWAHRTYLCLSRRRAGSEGHIPVSCHSRIKRNLNRSSSLPAAPQSLHSRNVLLLHWESSAAPQTPVSQCWRVGPCPCEELGQGAAGQVTQGTSPFLSLPSSSPSWPFISFHLPPVPCSSAQHKISRKMSEQGVTRCLSRQQRGEMLPEALYTPSQVSRSCQSLTPVHGGTGGVNGGTDQDPWCPATPAPSGSLLKRGAIEMRGEAPL